MNTSSMDMGENQDIPANTVRILEDQNDAEYHSKSETERRAKDRLLMSESKRVAKALGLPWCDVMDALEGIKTEA